ncbi:hypothetical protein [Sphingomonas sp. SCN 67-18]|uniref:hypothetical protein n=1 Tax=uncultured Sphingomonas sp. TaxID=158754 RepID=UPI000A602195|nr:hypothetical protein [Sphingomonas sp. SCN 67-18]
MTGGPKIVGLWSGNDAADDDIIEARDEIAEAQPMTDAEPVDPIADEGGYQPAEPGVAWLVPALCLLAAAAWIAFVVWTAWTGFAGVRPSMAQVGALIATTSAPLALIGVLYLLAMRTSRREAQRFGLTAATMRAESAALEARIADLSARLDANRTAMAGQADQLLALGEDATQRMQGITAAMRDEAEVIDRNAHMLRNSATAARADMAVLLASLPKAQVQTRQMVASLQEAGLGALEQAGALEAQLSSLVVRGREADDVAGGAAQRLAAHLARMEGTSETAGARIEQAAGQMTEAVDAALSRASDAVDEARKGMEAQSAAMLAMVEQSKAALSTTGADTAESLARRIGEINVQVEALGQALASHDDSGKALIDRLVAGLADVETRLAALDETGSARTERLGAAIAALTDHAARMDSTLANGGATAEGLIGRAETLLTALDASAREIDETLPAALARLDGVSAESRTRIGALAPDLEALTASANTAFDRLVQTEKLLGQQREAVGLLTQAASDQLEAGKRNAEDLTTAIGVADSQAKALAEGSGPALIEVMLRVRDTAAQAAERARESLSRIIPDAAQALGEASDDAMGKAISSRVEAQMRAIADAARQAAEAADHASDRLARQALSISESSAAFAASMEESRNEAEEANRESFARRVSLLIESLNSTAIDVTKILSNDVTDSAWAAYLKGDRGVFTRRAVKLLDTGESREVLRHYESDAEFRDQVNRYVHDFEAMLRSVLATRDGSALGVTILSSDMGKLYVALAQAIERLRT